MANVDYSKILVIINQTGLIKSNPALYKSLTGLMDTGSLTVTGFNADIANLRRALDNTFIYGTAGERANYKPSDTVGNLIFFYETDTGQLFVWIGTQQQWFPIGAPIDATYLTWTDESVRLPNSRNLVAGAGVDFDDTVPNVRTINSTGGFMPVNIGDLFMTIGDGNPLVIAFEYTP